MAMHNDVNISEGCVPRSRRFAVVALTSLATFIMLGCGSTTPGPNTQSGKPEISTSATTVAIKKALELEMVNIGFLLTSSQENSVVFEGDADKFTTFMNTNSYTGAKPKARYRANIIDMSTARRVLLTKWNITPGTSSNPSHEMEVTLPSQLQEMQSLLDKVKVSLGGASAAADASTQSARPSQAPVPGPARTVAPPVIAQPEPTNTTSPGLPSDRMATSEAQSILASLGYQPGPVDGSMGKRTVEALSKFQRDSKIAVTGIVDAATSQRLRAAKRP